MIPGRFLTLFFRDEGSDLFGNETCTERGEAIFDGVDLLKAKPAASKGRYVKKITLSSTMGPGVRVDTNRIRPDAVVASR